MEGTKILLSAEELNLVQDTHWLLTKNNIIEKAKSLFGELAEALVQDTSRHNDFPEEVRLYSPKVFKGEYYQGLPYVMLDYPRVFAKDDVFAIRTFFWWGNFFSVTLQLKGAHQRRYLPVISKYKDVLAHHGYSVAVSDDEWRHDFGPDNYQSIAGNGAALEKAMNGNFLKIAVRVPLASWNEAKALLQRHHETIVDILADQLLPMR